MVYIDLNGIAVDFRIYIVELIFQTASGKNFIGITHQGNKDSPFTLGQVNMFIFKQGRMLFQIKYQVAML